MKTLRLAGALWVIGMLGLPVVGSAQLAAPRSNRAAEALPATIPIFPLEDVVLFPNSSVPLHIFEPLEMVAAFYVKQDVELPMGRVIHRYR